MGAKKYIFFVTKRKKYANMHENGTDGFMSKPYLLTVRSRVDRASLWNVITMVVDGRSGS